ncbi:HAD family hydrolase [Hymenobacter sp. BT175]|uniref:HAD family hydrolase n=1 Tax=Hymenobacter translucens TaxID=2886507 RepID=UPI001D0F4371|nr:HAD family hydrolase [Hymenobacter translucens]MCC2545236.1 HAD family hydrolase [Hymenobacter translucens]
MATPVLVFDLDDTLYPELTYVHSGFRAVAKMLASRFALPADSLWQELVAEEAANGRGRVFNTILERHQLSSTRLVRACLHTYRNHQPALTLHPDAERCLARFAKVPLYLVTDGHKGVQARKVAALGLFERVRHAFITNRYGTARAKPSPYCFEQICAREKAPPGQVVYIGDNPTKDFVGIKPLEFRTVRVLRGNYAHLPADDAHEAHRRILTLDELTQPFLADLLAG